MLHTLLKKCGMKSFQADLASYSGMSSTNGSNLSNSRTGNIQGKIFQTELMDPEKRRALSVCGEPDPSSPPDI